MKYTRRLAASIALGAVAALCFMSGSQAAPKSWAEECNASQNIGDKPEITEGEQCCFDRMEKCKRSCGRIHDGTGAINQCQRACITSAQKCIREVDKAAAAPNRSRAITPRAGRTYESRVCCKTGRRYGWATRQDCRKRSGRAVHGRFCSNPAARTNPATGKLKSRPARVCCRRGRSHQWTSPSRCGAARGRSVHERYCRQASRLRTRPSGSLKICCKARIGNTDNCWRTDPRVCWSKGGIATVDTCCKKAGNGPTLYKSPQ